MSSKKRKVVSKAFLFFMLVFPYGMIGMEEIKIEEIDYISQLPSALLAQILAHLSNVSLLHPSKRDPQSTTYVKNFLKSSTKFWYSEHLAQAVCVSCINGCEAISYTPKEKFAYTSFSSLTKKPTIIDKIRIALVLKTSTFFKIIKNELKEKENITKVGEFLNQVLSGLHVKQSFPFSTRSILKFLLKARYPINSYISPDGEPLLVTLIRANIAAHSKHNLVELLLTYGADLALTDNNKKNALDYISHTDDERTFYEELFKKYSLANKKK